VTAQPLTPVIPSSGGPAAQRWPRSAAGRRLPLARPEPVPLAPEDTVYGIGRVDASGRISDRAVTSTLGWSGGDRLTLTADAGVVTARRDPGGMITLPARAYIAIPAALRRRWRSVSSQKPRQNTLSCVRVLEDWRGDRSSRYRTGSCSVGPRAMVGRCRWPCLCPRRFPR
jgi:hypothetical protein